MTGCFFLLFLLKTKQSHVASFVHQVLKLLASINRPEEQSQRTTQQAQGLLERLEFSIRRIFEHMRNTVGVGVSSVINHCGDGCVVSCIPL